jgi:hypothetical protein
MEQKSIFRSSRRPSKKLIKRKQAAEKQKKDNFGDGTYLFENNTNADFYLPRPTKTGQRLVRKSGTFIGDSYYFQLVKTNQLKFIKEEKMEEKLITEQPPVVTREGTVEYVVASPEKKLNEDKDQPKNVDSLLVESPLDGIQILS